MEYSLRDIISVFIWELPMKLEDIDITNDMMIIRDSENTKRIKISLLFEYFNQNYKIEQLKDKIEDSLRRIDDEYIPKYEYIIKELQFCDRLLNGDNGLKERFDINRTCLNALVISMAQCGVSVNELEEGIYQLVNLIKELKDKFSLLSYSVEQSEKKRSFLTDSIAELYTSVIKFKDDTDYIETNWDSLYKKLQEIADNSNNDISDKTDLISQRIDHEYDSILAVIDKYHHIHD